MVEGTCPVCLDIFSDPRILSCNHNVCLSCGLESRGNPSEVVEKSQKINSSKKKRKNKTNKLYNNNNSNNNNTSPPHPLVDNIICPVCRCSTLLSDLKPNIALRNFCEILRSKKNGSFFWQDKLFHF